MTWAKLDDGFSEHPKVWVLDDQEFRLHVSGITYCARNMTDGLIPKSKVPTLVPSYAPSALAILVNRGLWVRLEDDYAIHDFLDYHPSRATVNERRQSGKDRTAKWRDASLTRVDGRVTPGRDRSQQQELDQTRRDASLTRHAVDICAHGARRTPDPDTDCVLCRRTA